MNSDYILLARWDDWERSPPTIVIPSYCYSFVYGRSIYGYKSGQLWRLQGLQNPYKRIRAKYTASLGQRTLTRWVFSPEEAGADLPTVVRRPGGQLWLISAYKPDIRLRWVRSSLTEIVLDTIHSNG